MKRLYRYVRIGRFQEKFRYLSLELSPWLLAWRLYWHGKPLGFRRKGVRGAVGDGKRLIRVIIKLFFYRVFAPSADDVIDLPVFGHICLQVQTGYKIFDLRRGIVIKMFAAEVDTAIIKDQIRWCHYVGTHDLGPRVRRWNATEGWYEEDYVNVAPSVTADWVKFSGTLRESLVPMISRIIQMAPTQTVSALQYAENLSRLTRPTQGVMPDGLLHGEQLDKIRHFVEATIDRLRLTGEAQMFLTRSHGSFALRHVFKTKRGSMLIDWESSGIRSALFDFYDGLFRWVRSRGAVPGTNAVMAMAIRELQSRLASETSTDYKSLIASLSSAKVYRWIYYLEKLCPLLQRGDRLTERQVERMASFLGAYNSYEEGMLDQTCEDSPGSICKEVKPSADVLHS